jgi:hypothetical protein
MSNWLLPRFRASWTSSYGAAYDRYSGTFDSYGYLEDAGYKAAETQINQQIATVERIASEFNQDLAVRVRTKSAYGWQHYERVDACEELIGRLNTLEDEEAIFGAKGPQLSAKDMHPWVWGVAASLWDDGYRREAVQAAAAAIFDSHLPAKLGLPKGTQPRVSPTRSRRTRPPQRSLDCDYRGTPRATRTGRARTMEQIPRFCVRSRCSEPDNPQCRPAQREGCA